MGVELKALAEKDLTEAAEMVSYDFHLITHTMK